MRDDDMLAEYNVQARLVMYRVLDGHGGVDAVLVVEVDVIQTEAVQAGLAAGAHVLRPAADAPRGAAGGTLPPQPKLGGHLHLLSRQQLQRLHMKTHSRGNIYGSRSSQP